MTFQQSLPANISILLSTSFAKHPSYSVITVVELEILGWQLNDFPQQTYKRAILTTADELFVGDQFILV